MEPWASSPEALLVRSKHRFRPMALSRLLPKTIVGWVLVILGAVGLIIAIELLLPASALLPLPRNCGWGHCGGWTQF